MDSHELFLIYQTWATVPLQSSSAGKNKERTTHMDELYFSLVEVLQLIDWLIDWLIDQLTNQFYLLPGDLKVQLYCAKVINVYCNHLRPSCKQVFCLTGYTSHKDMSSKSFNFCDL